MCVLSGVLCNFVAVYLTFVQFHLQLKYSLYAIVHLLLEEFIMSLKSPTQYTFSMSHSKCRSLVLGSLLLESRFFLGIFLPWSQSQSPTKIRIPPPCHYHCHHYCMSMTIIIIIIIIITNIAIIVLISVWDLLLNDNHAKF